MFNEVAYINPKLAWEGRRYPFPAYILANQATRTVYPYSQQPTLTYAPGYPGDVAYAPGYGPGGVIGTAVETPGLQAPPIAALPVAATAPAAATGIGGIVDMVKGLETWQLLALAAGAYFLIFKK